MLKNYFPIYFKDISLSLGKYFVIAFLGLTIIALIIHINAILIVGVKSTELYIDILKLFLYAIPYVVFYITPFAFFIALIYLLYQYRKDNYILSLQMLGLSTTQIYRGFYATTFLVIIFHYSVCICILPESYKEFKTLQCELKQKHLTKFVENGIINTGIQGLAIYVDKTKGHDVFDGIFISDTRVKDITRVFFSKEGSIKLHGSEIAVVLHDGSYHQIEHQHSSFLYFDSYALVVQSSLNITKKSLDPYEMSILEMLNFNNEDDIDFFKKVKISLHQRFVWPIYSMIFAILCLRLEWCLYYVNYVRGKDSKGIGIMIQLGLLLSSLNFIMKNLSMKVLEIGTVFTYLNPILMLQMIFWMIALIQKTKKYHKNGK